jgi:D-alanine-D-alanine ligase
LRGGPSPEYDVSLKTGANILSHLRSMEDYYEPHDIFISRDGEWHRDGMAHDPHRAMRHIDVVFNAMHGIYGEDGQVQRLLERLGVPFTGSSAVASAVAMNKNLAKSVYTSHSLLTPRHELLERDEDLGPRIFYIFRNYMHPVIVKPAVGGSSIGVRHAHSLRELEEAIIDAFQYCEKVLVEEVVRGKEATCGVVEEGRGERLYALMPIEIRKPQHQHVWGYEAKYSGATEEICPGNFTLEERKCIEDMAKRAHHALGLRHYSRSDFIVARNGKVYILETNSLPGFTEESLMPKALKAVGWHPRDFLDHIIKLTLV